MTASKLRLSLRRAAAFPARRLPAPARRALLAPALSAALFAGLGAQTAHAQTTQVSFEFEFANYQTRESGVEICVQTSAPVSAEAVVEIRLDEDTATEPEDYRALTDGVIRVAANASRGCATIPIVNDNDAELDERFFANIIAVSPPSTSTQEFVLGVPLQTRIIITANDAGLSGLALSAGALDPPFAPGTAAYTAAVDYQVDSLTVTPEAVSGVSIAVNGDTVASGMASGAIALSVGANTIDIAASVQSAESAETTTMNYAVTVNRAAPSTDATLSGLALSAGALDPPFASGTTTYTVAADHNLESLTVTPTAADSDASITVNGVSVASGAASGAIALSTGANAIAIAVTAEDGTTMRTYTVTVARPAALSGLTLSAGTLDPPFAFGTTTYTVAVDNAVASLTVTPTAAGSGASITVNGDPVASGAASGAIALSTGANTIAIAVMADDGTTMQTYTVTVTRPAALSGLTLSAGDLSPALTAGVNEYDVSVGTDTASLTVTPTAIPGASVTVNGESVASGSASSAIDLAAGAVTTITIVVTTATGAEETYTLSVTRRAEEALNRITESLLPHVAQAVAAGTLSAISGRIDAAASAAGAPQASSPAGGSNLLQALKANERGLEDGTTDLARALGGSSFVVSLNAAEDGKARTGDVAVWGSGGHQRLSGPDDGALDWDGDMLSFHLGADVRMSPELLAGLAVSRSSGSFDYADRGGPRKGTYDSRMTGVHPYLSWSPSDGPRLWAAAGYGQGEVEISEEGVPGRSNDTQMWSAAVGGSHVLLSGGGAVEGRTATLRLRGEGALASIDVDGGNRIRATSSDVRRVRAALEGSYECQAGAPDGCLAPSLEIGMRHDGGDAWTGTGVEVGGGLRWTDRSAGLTAEARGRALVTSGDGYRDWSAGGLIRIDPGTAGTGLSLRLAPGFGSAAGDAGGLYDREGPADPAGKPAGRLETEVGYGFAGLDGWITPYSGLSLAGEGARDWRTGVRLRIGPALGMSLEGARRERADADPSHAITVHGRLSW